jgi:SOS-response transcriptional repressor LexA
MTSPHAGSKSFPEGTLIYVDPEAYLCSGKFVIAKRTGDNSATFKRYIEDGGKRWLMPLNPLYEKTELTEDMHICGVLIFSGTFE